MTIDTDKLKALALAVIERRPGWKSSERDFAKLANPATVLALIAEVERLRADAARLDFMIEQECQLEHMDRVGAAPVYRVRWPWTYTQQSEWSSSGREAIDEAIASKEPPCSS